MNIELAVSTLSSKLKEDKDFRATWIANMAQCQADAETKYRENLKISKNTILNKTDIFIIQEEGAKLFINLLTGKAREEKVKCNAKELLESLEPEEVRDLRQGFDKRLSSKGISPTDEKFYEWIYVRFIERV